MKKILLLSLSLVLSLSALASNKVGKSTLAVTKVTSTKAIENAMKANGTTDAFNRVVEAIDTNLLSTFANTRKFNTVSRKDLDAVIKEQGFADSGNADLNAVKTGRLLGARYVVTVTVDDFQDFKDKARFANSAKSDEVRLIRVGAIAKVIDSTTGAILETSNVIVKKRSYVSKDDVAVHSGGGKSDENIALLTREVCSQIANRMVDALFPPMVIAKTGKVVTFNRGDGSGVNVGDEYAVFALGEEMFDPGTGDALGAEEVEVGKLRVTSVTAKFTKGEAIQDNGISKGHVLRLVKKATPPENNSEDNEI